MYRNSGHVSHITVKDEGLDTVKGLYLAYGTDQKVGVAIWEEWRYDPNGPQIAQMNTDKEHMFSISVAIRDICGCDTLSGAVVTYSNQVVTEEQTRFLAGLGIRGREGVGEGGLPARFFHGDLIGSTMMETGPTGEVESTGGWEDSLLWQYTAFGEPLWAQPSGGIQRTWQANRYKYAGAYGYEWAMLQLAGANEILPPIMLLHVGERWYEPGTGRFVQRDPIGLGGGLNVYAYMEGDPVTGWDQDATAPVRTPHGCRDPRTGRWTKAPWPRRAVKWAGRRFPVYWAANGVVYVAYCIAGHRADYRDPVDELIGLAGDLINLINAQPAPPPPGPRPNPPVPCGPHY